MLSKNTIQFIRSLHQKKYRQETGLFIVEGTKITNELLNSTLKIKSVYATNKWSKTNYKIGAIEITEDELKKISTLTTPNEVLAVVEIPQYTLNIKKFKNSLSLVLNDVQDPGNMGTIIRIADWFGIDAIICSENSVNAFNPKVVQATMGSICRVKIYYVDLVKFLELQIANCKLQVFGAMLEGKNIYQEKLSSEGFIILGNESKGISKELLPFITDKIKIPSFAHNNTSAESLNVATAAAVICSEFRRR